MSFTGLLNDTLDVLAAASGSDDDRGLDDGAYTDETTDVACRVWLSKASEDRDERWTNMETRFAVFASSVTVDTERRVRWPATTGDIYEVLEVEEIDGASSQHHTRIRFGITR